MRATCIVTGRYHIAGLYHIATGLHHTATGLYYIATRVYIATGVCSTATGLYYSGEEPMPVTDDFTTYQLGGTAASQQSFQGLCCLASTKQLSRESHCMPTTVLPFLLFAVTTLFEQSQSHQLRAT